MKAFLGNLGLASVFAAQAFIAGCGGSALTPDVEPDAGNPPPHSVDDASSTNNSPGDVSIPTDTGADADGATECTASLDDLQRLIECPESAAQYCDAPSAFAFASLASADGLDVLSLSVGAGGSMCIYRSTDGALVGIEAEDDIPDFCNHTSNVETAGVQPPDGLQFQPLACDYRDAGPDVAPPEDGSAPCTGDFDQLATRVGCPAGYDPEGGVAQLCDAGGYNGVDVQDEDAGSALLSLLFGPGGSQCIYRASNGMLVGVRASSDEPDFCNGTSYTQSAGAQVAPGTEAITTVACQEVGYSVTDSGGASTDSANDSGQ